MWLYFISLHLIPQALLLKDMYDRIKTVFWLLVIGLDFLGLAMSTQ